MALEYYFSEEDILACLFFSYDVANHTYQRLSKSRDSFNLHIERILTGKLGEYASFKIFGRYNYKIDYKDAFKIWEGTENVDKFDLKVNDKTIDAKTLYKTNHRNMIVPQDQWKSMPKEFYLAVRLNNADSIITGMINNISLLQSSIGRKEFENNFKNILIQNDLHAVILGYLPRVSNIWIIENRSFICPEHPCIRAPIHNILPFEELLKIL